MQSQVRLNRVPEIPVKVLDTFAAEPGQVQQGSGKGSGEGLGPGQVQQGSGEGPVEVWEALVQSQVRFNRVPEMVPVKVLEKVHGRLWCRQVRFNRGGFGAEPGQVQQGSEVWEALVHTQLRYVQRLGCNTFQKDL